MLPVLGPNWACRAVLLTASPRSSSHDDGRQKSPGCQYREHQTWEIEKFPSCAYILWKVDKPRGYCTGGNVSMAILSFLTLPLPVSLGVVPLVCPLCTTWVVLLGMEGPERRSVVL